MQLQLALDRLIWDECLNIVMATEKHVDIIEVGTSIIKEYGMEVIRIMRRSFLSQFFRYEKMHRRHTNLE